MQIEAGLYEEAIENAQWVLQQDPDFPFVDAHARPGADPVRASR